MELNVLCRSKEILVEHKYVIMEGNLSWRDRDPEGLLYLSAKEL